MESNHKKFLSHLESSIEAVNAVAHWYERRGFRVEIPETKKAPTREQWRNYADNGDFYANWGPIRMRIEVKRLSYHFTCAEDWPFKPDFMLYAKQAYDRADPKPRICFVLNPSMSHAATVRSASFEHWTVIKRRDKRYENVITETYNVPLYYVCFFRIDLDKPCP